MTKEQIKNKIRSCAEMIADITDGINDDVFRRDINPDELLLGIDEARHLLNRLETYLEQYDDAE